MIRKVETASSNTQLPIHNPAHIALSWFMTFENDNGCNNSSHLHAQANLQATQTLTHTHTHTHTHTAQTRYDTQR